MNKFIQRSFFMLLLLIGFAYVASAQTVYTTKTGAKYHNDGCRYLSKSKIQTTVKDAKASGYTACKVCKPPLASMNGTNPNHLIFNEEIYFVVCYATETEKNNR